LALLAWLSRDYGASLAQWAATYGTLIIFCLICLATAFTLYRLWRLLPARGPITWIAIVAIGIWTAVGDPVQTATNWLSLGRPTHERWVNAILSREGTTVVAADKPDAGNTCEKSANQQGASDCGTGNACLQGHNFYCLILR